MKSFILNMLAIMTVVAVSLMNPLAGLVMSQTICDDDDDCLDI